MLAAIGEESRGDARKHRRDAHARRNVVDRGDAAVVLGGDGQAAAPELEVGELVERAAGLAYEVEAGHASVGRAVGDELGNVLRAHEQRLELTTERCSEGAWPGGANLQTGVGEQVAGLFGEPPLVWKCNAKHIVGPRGLEGVAPAQYDAAGNKKARPKGRAKSRPAGAPGEKLFAYPCTRVSPQPVGPW